MFSGREDVSQYVVFPNNVSLEVLPLSIPETVLPKDDRRCFVQEESLVLQLYLMGFRLRPGGSLIHSCDHSFSSARLQSGNIRRVYLRLCRHRRPLPYSEVW